VSEPEVVQGLVSTIIPVRNRPQMVVEAIESVRAQTWPHWEIIVADDVSNDDTPQVVESLAASEPRIILVRCSGKSGGPGAAREAGRTLARGEFVQYLDSDDLLLPEKFERQVALLNERTDVDIAYGWTKVQASDGGIDHSPGKRTGHDLTSLFPALLVDRWWFTSSPLYRRRITDRIGAWPTIRWGQDWSYDSIAGGLHANLASVNAFVSLHRHHVGDRQTGAFDWYRGEKLLAYHDLQVTIFESAVKAGVAYGTLEMLHFARLQFKIARSLAAEGHAKMAREALAMAMAAYGEGGAPVDIRVYHRLTQLIGTSAAGKLAVLRDRRPWSRLPS